MNPVVDGQWHRLEARTAVAVATLLLAPLPVTVLIMLISGAPLSVPLITAGAWVGVVALLCCAVLADWYVTRYRVTEERFELRRGVFSRSHRSIPRDRIRSVDLTADPAHRIFGLAVVKIGTGGQPGEGGELKLAALSHRDAESLRNDLLPDESTSDVLGSGGTIVKLRPAWLVYSLLTVSQMAIVWGALSSAVGSTNELLARFGVFSAVFGVFRAVPLWLSIPVIVLSALFVGVVGALLLSTEMWWNFHLTREPSGALRVRRGLFTTRSVSLEQRRLRGVEINEPMLLRWVGGARTNAVATGLGKVSDDKQGSRNALLPPAPKAEAHRVAAAVLHHPPADSPTSIALRPHPSAALRRRLFWGLGAAVPVVTAAVVVAAFGWLPGWAVVLVSALAVAIAVLTAVGAYRGLGHDLAEHYLITRRGVAIRRTVALDRDGIIGWRMRQSLFQRRAGIMHVAATTAAGREVYEIRDVITSDGLAVAAEAVPSLLDPFLEPA